MAENKDESRIAEPLHFTPESNEKLPHPEPVPEAKAKSTTSHLFGRTRSAYELLGSGKVADIVLWRRKRLSIGILVGSTLFYILFEWAGYTFLSVVSNTALLVLIILFIWSNLAAVVNRSPPPVPNMRMPEEVIHKATQTLHAEINRVLALFYRASLGRDWKLFLKLVATLYLLSVVGGFANFLMLLYTAILAALTLPTLYEKYGDHIEMYIQKGIQVAKQQWKKIDELVLSKIPRAHAKEKKIQ